MGWWRNIYDVDGESILYADVPITQSAEHTQELMSADYVQLSWVSPNYVEFPAGAIFKSDSAIYRLIEPYKPTQKDELTWEYKPQFHGLIGQLTKYPFLFVNDQNGTITREPDFEVTGTARVFMEIVKDVFEKDVEDGTQMHFTYDSSISKSVYLRFENVDIISALNMIAEAFETEWYYDSWKKTWHLGKTEVFDKEDGSRILLEVGNNVGVPSVTQNNEPYYNRYYAFGSTRNIMSDTQGIGNKVNTIVDKRLTLSPTKYPNGYYDTQDFLKNGEIYATTLIFDDVYPRATEGTEGSKGLAISDIITRTLLRLDENNQPIPTGEFTDLGEPKYETYTEYFFALNGADGKPKITITENDLMPDKDISCSFESGMLTGYEFVIEPLFHEKQYETISGLGATAKITIPAGYYRIRYIEEGGFIVPTNMFQGLYPAVGDEIALFNVKMPAEYDTLAQAELERKLQEEIARREVDNNVYQFKSNPVAFTEDNDTMRLLRIGTAVTYKNGGYELDTRVTKLVTKLDYDCEKTITIGNKSAKGTISQLKEEVAGVSTNVKLLEGLAESTEQILQAYKRTQESMMQGFARIKDMWVFDEKDANTIYSKYNIYSLGYVSTKGRSSNESGAGGTDLQAVWDSLVFNNDIYANYIINSAHIPNLLSNKITDFESAVKKYASIPTNISQLVNDAGYIKRTNADYYVLNLDSTYEAGNVRTRFASGGTTKIGISSIASIVTIRNFDSAKELTISDKLKFDSKEVILASRAKADTDLNNINGYGIMTNASNSNASNSDNTLKNNYPIGLAGTLFYGDGAYNSSAQIYGAYDKNRWFARVCQDSSGAKTAWKEFAFISDLANKADKATTLSGYGITDALRKATENYSYDLNANKDLTQIYPYFQRMVVNGVDESPTGTSMRLGALTIAGAGSASNLLFDHYSGGIWYRNYKNSWSNWKEIAFTNKAQTFSESQTFTNIYSSAHDSYQIGAPQTAFKAIYSNRFAPSLKIKTFTPQGKWYRVWSFAKGVASTAEKNAIITINKGYAYNYGQSLTFAISINNWEQKYVINQLSGTSGRIKRIRVTGYWDSAYVDVFIELLADNENFSCAGYGYGEKVDFEELGDDATDSSAKTEELEIADGCAMNYPLSLMASTPLKVISQNLVTNLNANYLQGLNKDAFVQLDNDQTITGEKIFRAGGGSNVPLRIRNTAERAFIQVGDTKENYVHKMCISALNVYALAELEIFAQNIKLRGSVNADSLTSTTGVSAPNIHASTLLTANSATFANGDIRINSDGLIMSPAFGINIGDYLTVNGGATEIWGDYFKIGANSTTFIYDVNIYGNANISSMITTDGANGVLGLDGNYINVLAPMNVLSTIKIGNATISYDYNSGMLKCDKGFYSEGAISTKGTSSSASGIASAQFGLFFEEFWRMATNEELSTYGASASILSGENATNNGTIVIACDAFVGKTIADVDVFAVGFSEAPSATMQLVPYKMESNKLYCCLIAPSLSWFTGFKIKVY